MLLQSHRASNRFNRLLTASLVAVVVLVCLKLLCCVVIDLSEAARSSGSPDAVVMYVVQPYVTVLKDDDGQASCVAVPEQ